MLTTEVFDNRVEVRAFGEITLADYQTFEEQVNYRIRFNGAVDLLLDLREASGLTLDVLVEEFRFSRKHRKDFGRVAVITEDNLMTWGAFFQQLYSRADIEVFETEEEARAWLDEGPQTGEQASTEETAS